MPSSTNEETTEKRLLSTLRVLNTSSEHMLASAVISRDGLCLAAQLSDGLDPDRLSAMCATLLSLADTAIKELECGLLQQVILYGSEGLLLLIQIGRSHVLAVQTTPTINVGMMLLNARKAAEALQSIVPAPE